MAILQGRYWLFLVPLMLLAVVACTPSEAQALEGILQNVDTVNGEVTIVTKDGREVTLHIDTQTPVNTAEGEAALEDLQPGASVVAEVGQDDQRVRRLNARQVEVSGVITKIEGNQVTVQSQKGAEVTALVDEGTFFKLEGDLPGALSDLQVGERVQIKFNPDSRVAFRIAEKHEDAEIEGIITAISDEEITIETETGHTRTVTVTDGTRIELDEDFPGTLGDLVVGMKLEAKFDAATGRALKIEVDEEEQEVKGVILERAGNEVVLDMGEGQTRTIVLDERTRVEVEDDASGGATDLREGLEVEVKLNSRTGRVLKVEVDD